jgi:hypothetical protein
VEETREHASDGIDPSDVGSFVVVAREARAREVVELVRPRDAFEQSRDQSGM